MRCHDVDLDGALLGRSGSVLHEERGIALLERRVRRSEEVPYSGATQALMTAAMTSSRTMDAQRARPPRRAWGQIPAI